MHTCTHTHTRIYTHTHTHALFGTHTGDREQASAAKTIFKLLEDKFLLLQPDNLPSATSSKPASAAVSHALANLADFENLVNSRLQDTTAGSRARGGKGGQQSGSSALSGYKREEALLSQQAEQVASQIRTLEVQLSAAQAPEWVQVGLATAM
eukprot:1154408-Pelagomonas_calceolata.AAC.2